MCIIKNCKRPLYGKTGYCFYHYSRIRIPKLNAQKGNFCYCGKPVFIKGLCEGHYKLPYKTPYKRKTGKCIIADCNIRTMTIYCCRHLKRFKHHLPFDLGIDCRSLTNKGAGNVHWKGGISEYPNHSLMKKIRKKKLSLIPICENCQNQPATEIHHIDKTKTNHKLNNFKALCHKCHIGNYHLTPKTTSKYIRLYGKTVQAMSEQYGRSIWRLRRLHQKGLLKDFLLRG